MNALFQLASVFYSEADTYRATVERIIETVHSHTFAVELAAKLLENGILTPDQLLTRLQVEKASFHNEDKIKIIKDGQSSKVTYYSHIHTLFSLYTLSLEQQDIMCNMCFLSSFHRYVLGHHIGVRFQCGQPGELWCLLYDTAKATPGISSAISRGVTRSSVLSE